MQEESQTASTDLPTDTLWWARYLIANRARIAKEFSTWILALLAAVPLIQEAVPDLHLGETLNHYVTIALAILGIVAKVVRQPSKGS